ncbi:MAG: L,D-transpeptidase family protein [Alphaproteobacteria bacterium]|nr:L,D-transpeptidase family protein [Alphaproteobacteria bacterium]
MLGGWIRTAAALALALLPPTGPAAATADLVVIEKAARRMTLQSGGAVLRAYDVALGRQPQGPKRREGDGRTPEGRYVIEARNSASKYHLALRISYPDAADRARAAALGAPPGGAIMIHGRPRDMGWVGPSHRETDWTEGCIAVTNQEMDEIWRLVPIGTPIEIRP